MTTPTPTPHPFGVTIVGTGSAVPKGVLTNADLEKVMDTSDEWIVQRTGIHTRYKIDRDKGESTFSLGAAALSESLRSANLAPESLDLIICATMTAEMTCPPTASRIANAVGAGNAGILDLSAACSGFVYSLNIAHDLIKGGAYRTVGVIGADTITSRMDYSNAGRSTAIIFGDAAGAAILQADPNPRLGILAQAMRGDGGGWKEIYVPECRHDFPDPAAFDQNKIGRLQMNGAGVFKFAVGTFPEIIQETLDKAGLTPADIDVFVCHQSNARILNAARERFGLDMDKLYINIERYGNTVAASVPLCLHELVKSGRVKPGMKVMFVAFGGGLTWGSSLWQL